MHKSPGFLLLSLLLLLVDFSSAQMNTPALERELSLTVKNEKIEVVLKKIEEQCSVVFSYSPLLLNSTQTINLELKNKSVREVLSLILPGHISFKSKNNYIILKEREIVKNQKSQKISGYVYDAQTNKKVPHVTVYDKVSLQSATSDDYGYYSITVPCKNASVTVNRVNYKDTSVSIPQKDTIAINNIRIQPKNDSIIKKDSAHWQKKLNLVQTEAQRILKQWNNYFLELNIKDSLNRELQFSFLPFIGTNHRLSGNVYNNYSFNILGGYSRGTKALEIGGLFNLDRENVKGIQIGGLMNVVGDTMNGLQIGGLTNVIGKKTNGAQIAGLLNLNGGTFNGLQIAGLSNYNQTFQSGVEIAGLLNYNHAVNGFQIAGLCNANDSVTDGMMLAGLINVSTYQKNASSISGCVNYAHSGSSKLQIAPCFNKTEHLTGIQIGLVNISDTSSGVPFGLFSYVKNGLHQLEVSADETQYLHFNFRSGVSAYHTIFHFAIQPYKGNALWSIGYGIGTTILLKNKWSTDINLISKHISIGQFNTSSSERLQLYWGLEYRFNSKFGIAAGPVMNLYVYDTKSKQYTNDYSTLAPNYSGFKAPSNGYSMQYWLGGQISLRFF